MSRVYQDGGTGYVEVPEPSGGAGPWTQAGTVIEPVDAAATVGMGDGTPAAPTYSFLADGSTGIYRDPATGYLGIAFSGHMAFLFGTTGAGHASDLIFSAAGMTWHDAAGNLFFRVDGFPSYMEFFAGIASRPGGLVTVSAGAGLGVGGAASLPAGNDPDQTTGVLSITTGAAPLAPPALLATITTQIASPKSSVKLFLTPANAAAAGAQVFAGSPAANEATVTSAAALAALTTYEWNYLIIG